MNHQAFALCFNQIYIIYLQQKFSETIINLYLINHSDEHHRWWLGSTPTWTIVNGRLVLRLVLPINIIYETAYTTNFETTMPDLVPATFVYTFTG